MLPTTNPTTALESWALPRLAPLLSLSLNTDTDTDALKQIVTYAASLPAADAAAHLRELLGEDDPRVWEFIAAFNARRARGEEVEVEGQKESSSKMKAKVKEKEKEEQQTERGHAPPPPSAQGPLVSDYLPNVRSKAQQSRRGANNASSSSSKPRGGGGGGKTTGTAADSTTTTTTTNNIADLTAAIAALEVTTNPKASQKNNNTTSSSGSNSNRDQRQKCSCNATLHPLFGPAPNCLSCGKIICALEGLQPCSFCATPLLSPAEVQDMIRELRAERGNEKMRRHNEGVRAAGGSKHGAGPASPSADTSGDDSGGSGGGGYSVVDTGNLAAAKAHRDKLLSFQAQNARRTRVVDEAADFDVPADSGAATQWMTPAQRALALKKQQRVLREMEARARPEWEKKQMVVSLDLKTGRAVRTLERADHIPPSDGGKEEEEDEDEGEDEEVEGDGTASHGDAGGAFARNPLLKGAGLVRPVWKASGDQVLPERRREQRQTWRRVQDDEEDNERWILDGGLRGYDALDVDGDGQGRAGVRCG